MQNTKTNSNNSNYNTQKHLTPSRRSVRSITNTPVNCHSSFSNHKGSKNVTYGQLQIVLENVQTLKNKASQQVKELTLKNQKLQTQITRLQELVDRHDSLEKSKEKTQNLQLQEANQKVQELALQLERKQLKIDELYGKNKVQELQLSKLKTQLQYKDRKIHQLTQSHQQILQKYTSLTKKLGVQDSDRQVQEISEEFKGIKGLLSMYRQIHSQKGYLQKQINKLTQENQFNKNSVVKCTDIAEKITQENQQFLKSIQQLHQQIKDQQKQLNTQQQLHHQQQEQFKTTLKELIQTHGEEKDSLLKEIENKEISLKTLSEKKEELEGMMEERGIREMAIEEEVQFKKIVDEVCSEQQDYDQVIRRVQYLEKYRNEYYYNIEKIQFLCKMLDY